MIREDFFDKNSAEAEERAYRVCRNALFLTDPEIHRAELISAKGRRIAGTCEWIQQYPVYQQWLQQEIQLLWINGGPGKGKTMMSIFLTQELEKHKDTIYYFCSCEDEKRNNAAAVLRGLLWQITEKRRAAAPSLMQYLEDPTLKKSTLSSRETLWIMFTKSLQQYSQGVVYCILDALDECDEDSIQWLVNKIELLTTDENLEKIESMVRLIIVSRDIPRLRRYHQANLDLDHNGQVKKDIELFVSVKVDELSRLLGFDERFRKRIQDTFLQRAEGTFLWIGFAMIELLKKKTWSQVEKAINDIPRGLPALYRRMLLQIEPSERQICVKLLSWVTMAYRPLRISELASAIETEALENIGVERAIMDLATLCEPLISICERQHDVPAVEEAFQKIQLDKIPDSVQETINQDCWYREQELRLVHQSARDFLLSISSRSSVAPAEFRIEPEKEHLRIAQACLECIMRSIQQCAAFPAPESFVMQLEKVDPFLPYATYYWPEHAKQARALAVD